jgi:DNA-3-methyladenine glycosylase I
MTERDVDRLAQDPSIIRNRAKIQATVGSARDEGRLAEPCGTRKVLRDHSQARVTIDRRSPHVDTEFAKRLRSQGYRFVGPTSVYAFMQNVGVVNDHIHGCFRAVD